MLNRLIPVILIFLILAMMLPSCSLIGDSVASRGDTVVTATRASACRVPNVVGLTQELAEEMLLDLGLQPVLGLQFDSGVAEHTVISQNPAPNTLLEPCQGMVDILISKVPQSGPSSTPMPTGTPEPTLTPTPIPPTPAPTPDPRLFWDDFESGIRPEWQAPASNFSVTNGQLIVEGGLWEPVVIGDSSWRDYAIEFDTWRPSGSPTTFQALVRVQDRNNYMLFRCFYPKGRNNGDCAWFKVVDGQEQQIAGTGFNHRWCQGGQRFLTKIDIDDNVFRIFFDGEQLQYFVDDTFSQGGFQLRINGWMHFDGINVLALP
ncbi:MAG: PASTA domain-containing protein [Anaerolineales bacterium]|nr:PASTA domain-containing protein [Anaerolineales bacterium]